jgi:hypothetical protein
MSRPGLVPSVAAVVLAVAVAACSVTDPLLRPGWRHVVMSVTNSSARPAVIVVAEDGGNGGAAAGKIVGTAEPGVVPPGATVDVAFGLPPEQGWAIFINPSQSQGPIVTQYDVPIGASGRAPLSLQVDSAGQVGALMAGDTPGWMGNP